MSLLQVSNLAVHYDLPDGRVHAVKDLSFVLSEGETLAIVGESGSGKSQSAFAIMGLLPENAKVSGTVTYEGHELLGMKEEQIARLRSREIAMIFQDPMTSLNPYLRIGTQMAEVLHYHPPQGKRLSRRQIRDQVIAMLEAVHIKDAAQRFNHYPHQFSGGMRQRVMIAMALLCRPKLLIADEPTTALDVTVQARIMDLLLELQQNMGMAVVFITHNLGVVAGSCARTLVMRHGEMVETAATEQLFAKPQHPYTQKLLAAVPRLDQSAIRLEEVSS
ncbi:ABC transporter ATP-binding protein [Polycladidibacter hongkongensis]|uniref:ABC transporter ATP-binding protein n=1 Tax=Polycladidibacter hongkongensis TaxID=1647556 RepID=UPI0009EAAD7D|nr:ABC transporter ATP-binding protein [Pseudovibrio hongkongensis]